MTNILATKSADLEMFERPSLDDKLPDGSSLPHTATYYNGVVSDWTGRRCRRCKGTGEPRAGDNPFRLSCISCAGTGDEYGPLWLWEE